MGGIKAGPPFSVSPEISGASCWAPVEDHVESQIWRRRKVGEMLRIEMSTPGWMARMMGVAGVGASPSSPTRKLAKVRDGNNSV